MDTEDLIDLVRREHGVVLDPSDPVFASATIARALSEEDRTAVREMLAEMRRVAAEVSRTGILSPDAEHELIGRVEKSAAQTVPQAVQRALASWHSWIDRRHAHKAAAAGLALLVVGLGSGFAGGWFWQADRVRGLSDTMTGLQHEVFRDGKPAADQWVAIATYNHIGTMMKDCKATVVNGRRRCDVPVWLDPEPQGR